MTRYVPGLALAVALAALPLPARAEAPKPDVPQVKNPDLAPVSATDTLKVGDMAPDFTLPDQNGGKVTLSSFRGKKNVVLAVYVLAFTGG